MSHFCNREVGQTFVSAKTRQTGMSAPRPGSLLIESMAALAIIAIVGIVVAQGLVWSTQERARLASHQAALELAANVLEAARAQPFEQLDQAWADAQTVPSDMADLLQQGKVLVTVETPKTTTATRRVTVEVRWHFERAVSAQTVQLTTVLSGRMTKKDGGAP